MNRRTRRLHQYQSSSEALKSNLFLCRVQYYATSLTYHLHFWKSTVISSIENINQLKS